MPPYMSTTCSGLREAQVPYVAHASVQRCGGSRRKGGGTGLNLENRSLVTT